MSTIYYLRLMRLICISTIISILFGSISIAQNLQPPQIIEKKLANGIRVLLVTQPNTGCVHAHIFIKGGRSDVDHLPPVSADLLANTLFRRILPNELNKQLMTTTHQATLLPNQTTVGATNINSPIRALSEIEAYDKLDLLGASGRSITVTNDYCAYGIDLPKNSIESWLQIEAERLRSLPLARFQIEQSRLMLKVDTEIMPSSNNLYTLITTMLPGEKYTIANKINPSQIASITLDDINNYAKRIVSPKNISLVLIGDVTNDLLTISQLENTLGRLPIISSDQIQWKDKSSIQSNTTSNPFEVLGNRRLVVNTTDSARILFGWYIPPINHPDRLMLIAMTRILEDRCKTNLINSRNAARKLSVKMGVPGQKNISILFIEAEPQKGHSINELEHVIEYEVARLQQEPLSNYELHQLQTKIRLDELLLQEDASELAETLGGYLCQWDNWHLAFTSLETNSDLTSSEIQLTAQTYLTPHKMTIVSFDPSFASLSMDPTASRLIQIFKNSLEHKSYNTVKIQKILGEASRQLQMLSSAEREQILKSLNHQVQP